MNYFQPLFLCLFNQVLQIDRNQAELTNNGTSENKNHQHWAHIIKTNKLSDRPEIQTSNVLHLYSSKLRNLW